MLNWLDQFKPEYVYLAGALLRLATKYLDWIYVGIRRQKKAWWPSTVEWFELQTVDSKVSWIATIAVVWAFGYMFIKQVGLGWLFGGALKGAPVCGPLVLVLGILAEQIAPAFLKWLATKLSFLDAEGS